MITLSNEIVNFLMKGVRADVVAYRGTSSSMLVDIVDTPEPAITKVTIRVEYQKHGDLIKEYVINQAADSAFTWSINKADFENQKALNYWVEAVDQNDTLLFYGTFTLL